MQVEQSHIYQLDSARGKASQISRTWQDAQPGARLTRAVAKFETRPSARDGAFVIRDHHGFAWNSLSWTNPRQPAEGPSITVTANAS